MSGADGFGCGLTDPKPPFGGWQQLVLMPHNIEAHMILHNNILVIHGFAYRSWFEPYMLHIGQHHRKCGPKRLDRNGRKICGPNPFSPATSVSHSDQFRQNDIRPISREDAKGNNETR